MTLKNPCYLNLIMLLQTLAIVTGCLSGGGGGGGGDSTTTTSQGTPIPNGAVAGCFLEDYSDPSTSEYILPFQVGMAFLVVQGNCGSFSTHRPNCTIAGGICGDLRYAYDFQMPIGIVLLAARNGTATLVSDSFPTSGNTTNIVVIEHDDGTLGRYLHLAQNSSFVMVGDSVNQGDPIAMSGNSGPGGGVAHLHFDVLEGVNNSCNSTAESGCVSIPVTFRNANPLDAPLIEGSTYEALPF